MGSRVIFLCVLVTFFLLILVFGFNILHKIQPRGREHRNITNADLVQTPSTFFPDQYFQEQAPRSRDEIQLNWASQEGFPAMVRINLAEKTWFYSGACASPSALDQGPLTPLSEGQISLVRQFLLDLPPTRSKSLWSRDDYLKEYHIAFYTKDKLANYHYPKSSPPIKFEALLKYLKLEDYYK